MGLRRIMVFFFLLLWCCVLQMLHLHGQETDPGFISINCGSPSEYYDDATKLNYATDDQYVDSGQNMHPQVSDVEGLGSDTRTHQSESLRSFPNGTRNCYTLIPTNGKNNTYLIRASFFYGNYDGKNQIPIFDLHIGVNYWRTVGFSTFTYAEIMYVAPTDEIQVCLINTGNGIPYITVLELRLLANSIYQLDSKSLSLKWRGDIGRNRSSSVGTRYPADSYDRIWTGSGYNWTNINTTTLTATIDNDAYKIPENVLKTASIAADSKSSLQVLWEIPAINSVLTAINTSTKQCVYFHFFELQSLPNKQQREFNIYFSNRQQIENISLEYLKPLTVISPILTGSIRGFSITATDPTSQYPPVLNALERFDVIDHPNVPTSLEDVNAIVKVKKAYTVMIDSWQGDPCMPKNYIWEGLSCSYDGPPRVVSLNLSSRMLTGDIARATSLSNLLALETLDMSHNQLTGQIPEFLGKLPNLKVLDLSGNNLSGNIPKTIQKKIADNSLDLSISGNQKLCMVVSCQPKRKKNDFIIPVIASVVILVALLLIALAIIWRVRDRKKNGQSGGTFKSKNRSFTYKEVLRITENSKTVIGEGGFGKVYLGTLADGSKVAVKMLSQSSKQGFSEFQSEAQLLMVVHHRNLVSLVGYCNDSQNMVLIYEFMERGNVREHLSEVNPNILTWKERLQIVLDAAQGLDYLHNGCRPAIIHSDLKPSNILLNKSMQAKIADFGLSKAFAMESGSHITTRPAGTPGYLDPEFQRSGNLTRKSDVYSFGIVLLELVTGHPPIVRNSEGYMIHLPQWVTPIIESGDIHGIVDPRLNKQFNINSAWKVIEIAMSCVSRTAIQRPDISQVLSELKECWNVEMAVVRSPIQTSTVDNSILEMASCAVLDDSTVMPR